jgi:mitochondrial fission protein ELM1
VIGLAEAIGLPFEAKVIRPRWPWTMMPVTMWPAPFQALGRASSSLAPPWPDLVIGCGWRSIPFMLAIKRLNGGKTLTVQTQDPRIRTELFDIVVAPEHDRTRGGNVFSILGSPNRVTQDKLAAGAEEWRKTMAALPQPRVAVLIGGTSKAYRLTPQRMREIAEELKGLLAAGAGLMITTSRRTGTEQIRVLSEAMRGTGAYLYTGDGPNPYFGLLGLADSILVTADSTNMITEAASTGKPVHIVPLLRGSLKFSRFHEALVDRGIARPFTGRLEKWTYPPLAETARAAAFIRARLGQPMTGL